MSFASSHRSVLQALLAGTALLFSHSALAQETPPEPAPKSEAVPPAALPPPAEEKEKEKEKTKPWYETLRLRGYTQVRYNRLPSFRVNDALINEQGDRFLGKDTGFGIRRARLVVFGDVHPHVSIYLQPDFASVIGDQYNVAVMRDWYADIFVDAKKEFRFRVGQSKVPFGFENLQSSQNRLALDRNDGINSALKDERDLGVFFYWAPAHIRERFKFLVDSGLKGSGDYGVVGLGVFNGQAANRAERNNSPHAVARVTYPFLFGSQYVEAGVGGYYGRFNTTATPRDDAAYALARGPNMVDARGIVSLTVYPQPLGFQAEYNFGRGPSQGSFPDEALLIDSRKLQGGYAQLMYKLDGVGGVSLIPYVRGTLYKGGKKFETNAPLYDVRELELGAEWQIWKALELTAAYVIADRTSSRYPYAQEQGHVTRLQLQFNY
ncbi:MULTISPECIES: porin [unclassified Corallococcus]|uniref:porin n=1 Tax=unclassified Corallococcus TaxID=2685029 RepID=UPI001A907AD6|nr:MULTISPECIES: porin [unclassified Corallococcus]MBN9683483.1 porin [Corallococcus sp. NCSPR001]WAS85000.1 porin [Corallococcus sp. NCRR]